jgi:glutamyl-tRNA synthetase
MPTPQALIANSSVSGAYRGRIAPTPTGWLHLGHARTFATAWQRARQANGQVVYRDEDLDPERCQPVYSDAAMEDLRWLGLDWDEGPDIGGPHAPYRQSDGKPWFLSVWQVLHQRGVIYPCTRSRKDVREAGLAPHAEDAEPLYPVEWRPPEDAGHDAMGPEGVNWRLRVPVGETITFADGAQGEQSFTAGVDFGDFLVWRKDGMPTYELAVVADDHRMGITEVVRGADLLVSTARQLLLYRALGWPPPTFFHVPLVCDTDGKRLAKRHQALSLRTLRERGISPEDLLSGDPRRFLT